MGILPETGSEEVKFIPLSKGKFAIVDSQDFDWLNQWKWCFWSNSIGGYAARIDTSTGRRIKISMHRLIFEKHNGPIESGLDIDHRDTDKLNNRISNLRSATRHQNSANRGGNRRNISGYKGVSLYDANRGVWRAQIMIDGKKKGLGYFKSAEEAAFAYNVAAKEAWGEFAYQNKVDNMASVNRLVYRNSRNYHETRKLEFV